jgi:hypothetical protein
MSFYTTQITKKLNKNDCMGINTSRYVSIDGLKIKKSMLYKKRSGAPYNFSAIA